MKKILGIFLGSALTLGAVAETSFAERYPGPWREGANLGISKALVANNIRGCGEFKYRESSRNRGEFLVYCSRDGSNWSAYFVWPSISKVTGPHQISPAIAP